VRVTLFFTQSRRRRSDDAGRFFVPFFLFETTPPPPPLSVVLSPGFFFFAPPPPFKLIPHSPPSAATIVTRFPSFPCTFRPSSLGLGTVSYPLFVPDPFSGHAGNRSRFIPRHLARSRRFRLARRRSPIPRFFDDRCDGFSATFFRHVRFSRGGGRPAASACCHPAGTRDALFPCLFLSNSLGLLYLRILHLRSISGVR